MPRRSAFPRREEDMDRNNFHDPRSFENYQYVLPPFRVYHSNDPRELYARINGYSAFDPLLSNSNISAPVLLSPPFSRNFMNGCNTASRHRRESAAGHEDIDRLGRMVTARCREASLPKVSVDFAFQEMRRQLIDAKMLGQKYLSRYEETFKDEKEWWDPEVINLFWRKMLERKYKKEGAKDRFLNVMKQIDISMQQIRDATRTSPPPSPLRTDDSDDKEVKHLEKRLEYERNLRLTQTIDSQCEQIVTFGRKALGDRAACETMVAESVKALSTLSPFKVEGEAGEDEDKS